MSSRGVVRSKKGVDAGGARTRREGAALSIRKGKKDENLMKRRQAPMEAWGDEDASAATTTVGADGKEVEVHASTSNKFKVADFPAMYQAMLSSDLEVQVANLRGFRRLLSAEKNPPVQECIDSGAVPVFVQFLSRDDSRELQFEAAWALTNIASTDYTTTIVEANAVPHLVKLLLNADPDVRDQSAWCLGNIAGDSPTLRDAVLEQPGECLF